MFSSFCFAFRMPLPSWVGFGGFFKCDGIVQLYYNYDAKIKGYGNVSGTRSL